MWRHHPRGLLREGDRFGKGKAEEKVLGSLWGTRVQGWMQDRHRVNSWSEAGGGRIGG